jgi:hypothetical protein
VSRRRGVLLIIGVMFCLSSSWCFAYRRRGVLLIIGVMFCLSSAWCFAYRRRGALLIVVVVLCLSSSWCFAYRRRGVLLIVVVMFCLSSSWCFAYRRRNVFLIIVVVSTAIKTVYVSLIILWIRSRREIGLSRFYLPINAVKRHEILRGVSACGFFIAAVILLIVVVTAAMKTIYASLIFLWIRSRREIGLSRFYLPINAVKRHEILRGVSACRFFIAAVIFLIVVLSAAMKNCLHVLNFSLIMLTAPNRTYAP